MIPYDIVGALREGLLEDKRPSDGLLHCSSDLLGSLRHAQLHIAGAPKKPSSLVSDIRLKTGTMWHEYFNHLLIRKGWPVMHEVRMHDWLPEGWGGTADWLFWSTKHRAFVLGDLKTKKGEGMRFVERDGASDEHRWQTSAYYHALVGAKFPMVKGIAVMYLPMNDVGGEGIEPEIVDFDPVPREEVWDLMAQRWAATQEYLYEAELPSTLPRPNEMYLHEKLAPPIERIQKIFKSGDKWEVKLVPHWSTQFCPFENDLCDCSEQGQTKIGAFEYDSAWGVDGKWIYNPRKGYEDIATLVTPPENSRARLRLAA